MPSDTDAEIVALRTMLRDLVALSAIPTAWVGREPAAVAAGLADALADLLQLDFVFVRLRVPSATGEVDAIRGKAWNTFPEWLECHLPENGRPSGIEIIPGIDEEKFRQLAEAAEKGCPISRLLNAEITLDAALV